MRFNNIIVGSAALAASVFASPTPSSSGNANQKCGASDSITQGSYTISQNLFGASSATSGEQCTTFVSLDVDTISWSTSWTWEGDPSSPKSFAVAALNLDTFNQISEISSIPTSWTWSGTGTDVVANAAYSIDTTNGDSKFLILIVIAAFGDIPPIGVQVDFPLIDGSSWELFQGVIGEKTVYTFVADENTGNFVADIKDFLGYLVDNEGFSDEQVVQDISAGTGAFTGSDATFDVQSFTLSINVFQ